MIKERRLFLALMAACLVLFSFQIGNHDFWDPDEPRYAGVARNILESGDWIRLTDNGEAYTQKPPLFFWILAAAAKLGGGLNETTSRIPAGIAGLLCVAVVYRLGNRLFNSRVGWLSAMTLATSQRFFLEARWVHMDTLLTLFVVLAMQSAYTALRGSRRDWVWMYGWMALGCLVKGPLGLALPAVGVLVYMASTREMSRLKESGWFWGLPLCLLPVLFWLLASSRLSGINPGSVVSKQVFQRLMDGVHHPRPFYYYLYSLPLEFLPWTLFLPSILRFTFPAAHGRERGNLLFLYGWIVGGLALLSLVAEKRPSYLLPLFPALALLAGFFFDSFLTRYDASGMSRWIQSPIALGGVTCLVGTIWLANRGTEVPGFRERIVPLGLFLCVACTGALWLQRRGRRGAVLIALLAAISSAYLWIVGAVFPWLNQYKSARPFCERILHRIGESPLGIYGDYLPAFAYYTHRRLQVVRTPGDLEGLISSPPGGACIVPKDRLPALRAKVPLETFESDSIGHRSFVLVGRASSADDPPRPQVGASPR
ncbi:MAG: glycosyltransferase family 39 protein [Acidobacteria bacterium]|nr:glycosyltransferase family 39 protein [Acidobacteriota bacterium]